MTGSRNDSFIVPLGSPRAPLVGAPGTRQMRTPIVGAPPPGVRRVRAGKSADGRCRRGPPPRCAQRDEADEDGRDDTGQGEGAEAPLAVVRGEQLSARPRAEDGSAAAHAGGEADGGGTDDRGGGDGDGRADQGPGAVAEHAGEEDEQEGRASGMRTPSRRGGQIGDRAPRAPRPVPCAGRRNGTARAGSVRGVGPWPDTRGPLGSPVPASAGRAGMAHGPVRDPIPVHTCRETGADRLKDLC
ncbi:hypothetical protein GCM10010512_04670 [Streptomyces thermoviolaceus subsp. thermoviolaceus]|nr:hypothetical protein GCM10010512_04670 [Streptomyces thermoviolaceus subsp. thermoviolaceus]